MTQPSDRPKRFYKTASIAPSGESTAWRVELDGRSIKTPARHDLLLPTEALAAAIAQEWEAQGEALDLAGMTLTRLANVAIDRTPSTREAMADELAKYAETDVVCFLTEDRSELRRRQDEAWRPWRDWAGRELNILLVPVEGLIAAPQPAASLDAVRAHALQCDDFRLTGLNWGCSLLGSAVLALAVEQGALEAELALKHSCIDEDWQIEQWGEDAEAKQMRAGRERDAAALEIWMRALST